MIEKIRTRTTPINAVSIRENSIMIEKIRTRTTPINAVTRL